LTAAVAVALLLGSLVSGAFALAERRGRIRADKAERAAVAANESTERALARSYITPLVFDDSLFPDTALMATEAESLWQLAENSNGRMVIRFIEAATVDPLTTRQVAARREPTLIAAVGLDNEKRLRARELLATCLREPSITLIQRMDLANIALELEEGFELDSGMYAGIVSTAVERIRSDPDASETRSLLEIATRLEPATVARALTEAIEANPGERLAIELERVAPRLEPATAAATCARAERALASAAAGPIPHDLKAALNLARFDVALWLDQAAAAHVLIGLLDDLAADPEARGRLISQSLSVRAE
jgi:hypothetical protein